MLKYRAQAARIEVHGETQNAFDRSIEYSGIGARRVADEIRADHRRERQRNQRRYGDRKGERDRELAEHPADQACHEQERNKRRDQRDADRDHSEPDLLRALDGSAERRHALFEITEAVLDHDNGVVNHEADGYGERHQREIVDGETGNPHRRAGSGERQGYGDPGGQGRRYAPEENKNDQHDKRDGCKQRELHVAHAGTNGLRSIRQNRDVDGGRNPALELR